MKNIKIFLIIFLLIPIVVLTQPTVSKVNPQDFTFAVIGDRTGGAKPQIFRKILSTIHALNPDFVINVGDLIEGYTQNQTRINLEWDSIFTDLGRLKEKFYFTPGNHDIWDSLSYQIYLNRIGYSKPYYNFSIGKNHFMVIDNSRQEKPTDIDTVQLKWLNSTLSKFKKQDRIFCFLHKSFWKDAYINNRPDSLHKLFVKYGVDYVFSGHDHFYCQLNWDGITYTQIGPSGSRYKIYRKEELGAFQNFCVVTVKKNDVAIKVFKVDDRDDTSKMRVSELKPDVVTLQDIQEVEKIESAIQITAWEKNKNNSLLTLTNINETPITVQGEWIIENNQWSINPMQKNFEISANGSVQYEFFINIKSESIYPLPRLKLHYPYAQGKKVYAVERLLPIKLTTTCSKTQKPITLDGWLNEPVWQKSKPVYIFGSSEGKVLGTDPWQVNFAYDKNYIYIGAKMWDNKIEKLSATIKERDEKVYNDDHLNLILQPTVSGDTYYQFFVNPHGIVMDRICYLIGKDSKKDAKWNSDIISQGKIVNTKSFRGWILEIAIPLKDLTFKISNEWGFNLARFQKSQETVSIYSVPFEHNPKTFAILKFIE